MNDEKMRKEQFSRTERLLGRENMERLSSARVAVFGIGGVGGHAMEALARSGIGALDLVDSDRVCLSNLNRQIIATRSTLGMYKVDAAKERILDINPEAKVTVYRTFFLPENADSFPFEKFDYIVDAIDTVAGKLALAEQAARYHVPVISSMGAGNKMEASALMVSDIFETSVCPLARVMRRELKKRGIHHLKVVYSREIAMTPKTLDEPAGNDSDGGLRKTGRLAPGSNAFVPAAAGLILAGEVIKDLTGVRGQF